MRFSPIVETASTRLRTVSAEVGTVGGTTERNNKKTTRRARREETETEKRLADQAPSPVPPPAPHALATACIGGGKRI
eukprot:422422-Pyramimonas_sp.AAC.1